MENVTTNGQYGKRNPLFMYQGTEGYAIRAALSAGSQAEQEAQVFRAVAPQSGDQRCGAMMQ